MSDETDVTQNIIVCMLSITILGFIFLFGLVQYKSYSDEPQQAASVLQAQPSKFVVTPATDPSQQKPPLTRDLNWAMVKDAANVSNVAVNDKYVFYLNKTGQDSGNGAIARGPVNGDKTKIPWTTIPGQLTYIDAGNNWIWGYNSSNQLFKCQGACENGNWVQVPVPPATFPGVNYHIDDKLMGVSTNDKHVWLVNNSQVFRCKEPCEGTWEKKGEIGGQISAGANQIWTLRTPDSKTDPKRPAGASIGFCVAPCDDSSNWQYVYTDQDTDGTPINIMEGRGSWITAKDPGSIWLTTPTGMYRCRTPCFGNWEKVNGVDITRKQTYQPTAPAGYPKYDPTQRDLFLTGTAPTYVDANSKYAWASMAGIPNLDPNLRAARSPQGGGELAMSTNWL